MALTVRKTFKVYLDGAYYDTFNYVSEKNIYQGEFGYLTLRDMEDVIDGLLPHIQVELANE